MEFRQIEHRKRRHIIVPEGSWFVTHSFLQEETLPPEQLHLHHEASARWPTQHLTLIGSAIRNIVLVSDKYRNSLTFERRLLWSERPFAVHLRTIRHSSILLPREVGSKGSTSRAPVPHLPPFIESTALPHQKAPYRWTRLIDVAALAGRDPIELLERHLAHFNDVRSHVPGIHLLIAPNEEAACQKTTFSRITIPQEMTKVVRLDPSTFWVRKRFTMTVLTLEALGYPIVTTNRPSHVPETRDALPSSDSA